VTVVVSNVSRAIPTLALLTIFAATSIGFADVMKLITKQGMLLAIVGVALGFVLALALAQVISSLLIGVSGYDVSTFIVVPVLLTAVALVACYLPARRATKVDPLVALRYE
jgi:putative ABC transport system permease protein